MDNSLDELRRELKRLRQDIEGQAQAVDQDPGLDGAVPAGGEDAPSAVSAPADEPARVREAVPVSRVLPAAAVLPAHERPASEPAESYEPLPAGEPLDGAGSSRILWAKALQVAGLGLAAVAAFLEIPAALGTGLVVCLVGVLASGLSASSGQAASGPVNEALAARVAVLERRLSAVSRAGESGAISREVIEEIVELRRILATLFKAIDKPMERS